MINATSITGIRVRVLVPGTTIVVDHTPNPVHDVSPISAK